MTICRFQSKLLLKYAKPCRNWTFQHIEMAAQKTGSNRTNEKYVTR